MSRRRGKNIELRQLQPFILIPPANSRIVGDSEIIASRYRWSQRLAMRIFNEALGVFGVSETASLSQVLERIELVGQ